MQAQGAVVSAPMKATLFEPTKAAWLTVPAGAVYSGLSGRLLQNAIAAGLVRSSIVKMPNAKRGRRLIERASLDRWIEQGVGERADLPHLADNCARQAGRPRTKKSNRKG